MASCKWRYPTSGRLCGDPCRGKRCEKHQHTRAPKKATPAMRLAALLDAYEDFAAVGKRFVGLARGVKFVTTWRAFMAMDRAARAARGGSK